MKKAANVVFGFLCVCFEFDLIWLVNCIFNFFFLRFLAFALLSSLFLCFCPFDSLFFLIIFQHYFPRCSFTFFFNFFFVLIFVWNVFHIFLTSIWLTFFYVNYTINKGEKKSMISKRTKIKTGKKVCRKNPTHFQTII